VEKTCKNCFKCSESCETKAISFDKEPDFIPTTISNNPGVCKYYVNVEKCYEFWIENSSDCGNCIAVCPFSGIKKYNSALEFWEY